MTNETKWLLLAGVAGVGLWWWLAHGQGHMSLAAHVIPPATPGSSMPADQVTASQSLSSGTVAVSPFQSAQNSQAQQVQAILNWTKLTKNPPLYVQMVDQASASDIAGLYDLVTTYWAGLTTAPTAAQAAFWNDLRSRYPFLNYGGVSPTGSLCVNFQCI